MFRFVTGRRKQYTDFKIPTLLVLNSVILGFDLSLSILLQTGPYRPWDHSGFLQIWQRWQSHPWWRGATADEVWPRGKKGKKKGKEKIFCLVEITPKWPQESLGLWYKLSRQVKYSSNSTWKQLSMLLPVKLCVIHSKADHRVSIHICRSFFVFQVALNTEIEILGKSYGDNNLDENLTYMKARNNHTNKAIWVSKEEFQVYVCAVSSLTPVQMRGPISCSFLPWCNSLQWCWAVSVRSCPFYLACV